MLSLAKSIDLSCNVVVLRKFLTSFSLLKLLSADATEAGKDKKILNAMQTFGKIVVSF